MCPFRWRVPSLLVVTQRDITHMPLEGAVCPDCTLHALDVRARLPLRQPGYLLRESQRLSRPHRALAQTVCRRAPTCRCCRCF
ncbi:hypothetical protein EVAR_93754_1 [Eumeta japonica]|uniref:Uncharacterized protein n=1 Tax=Eumeta variegata TaxID=151549 RepID=A0A4C2ACD7_EUMVA|nr:hypothetical protein EVAR_93754_1 [Eumeta japonica]